MASDCDKILKAAAKKHGQNSAQNGSPSKPGKDLGYRDLSALLASDNDFMIFRRFGSINVRLLLRLQDSISVLKDKLERIECQLIESDATGVHNGTFREESCSQRTEILDELNTKAREYNELLIQNKTLHALPVAPERNVNSISNWFYNNQNAILKEETEYITKTHDLIQLVPKSSTPLRKILEKSSRFRHFRLWKEKTPPLSMHSAHLDTLHYHSETRMDTCIGVTVVSLGVIMLIAPLWALAYTSSLNQRLGVITGFIVLFLGLVSFTTAAKAPETLAATAACAAVLAVFLQSSR